MLPTLLTSPLARYGLLVAGAVVAVGVGYMWAHGRGRDACEMEHQAAVAGVLQRQAALVEAARARGDVIAADLAKTQQALATTKTEYLTYAHAITGHCPGDLGVLVGAASGGGAVLPPAPGKPADQTPTIEAAAVAANVAENYGRFAACYAQLNALIDWHQKDLTK